jgi:hypothetical protein
MSRITKDKYYNFMLACYNAKEFNLKQMQLDYKVTTRIAAIMRERGMIMRRGEHTVWIGDEPTRTDASLITKECQRITKIIHAQRKAGTAQLTLKPLKRVERCAPKPVPQSIIDLNEKISEYPIMDVVIAFLAGLVIAGMFSLIWK